ncbi:LPXTG cell wall anchor domain-containing protein [Loigolactobacillus coryniformis]|uniref:LPXTG cell wall anchor domain-containing protein n=1 Tax=Loigolactobacillus coryniformis TaxID=1610 RepID=UPI0002194C38|nr:LPXTG cell wall anchor domain-containing protein [Loigolactobacillus coryniformis]KRK66621.1 hypothetical protein FC16_GL001254 [Loigolactobacillus coryniformis subsp. torquens DSM 20004 = KCTC 3535]
MTNNSDIQKAKIAKSSIGQLPQTGENKNQTASIFGLVMIGLVGLFGITKRRKKI